MYIVQTLQVPTYPLHLCTRYLNTNLSIIQHFTTSIKSIKINGYNNNNIYIYVYKLCYTIMTTRSHRGGVFLRLHFEDKNLHNNQLA